MRKSLLMFSVGLFSSLLGPSCSSATDQKQAITSTPDDYCQRRCEKAHSCTDTINPAECRTSCQSAIATEPELRADLLGYVAGCVETSECGSTLTAKCMSEARAQLSLSKYGEGFCTAYVAAGNQCDPSGASYPESACLEAAKSYADSALRAANDCLAKPCSELSACLGETVPNAALSP